MGKKKKNSMDLDMDLFGDEEGTKGDDWLGGFNFGDDPFADDNSEKKKKKKKKRRRSQSVFVRPNKVTRKQNGEPPKKRKKSIKKRKKSIKKDKERKKSIKKDKERKKSIKKERKKSIKEKPPKKKEEIKPIFGFDDSLDMGNSQDSFDKTRNSIDDENSGINLDDSGDLDSLNLDETPKMSPNDYKIQSKNRISKMSSLTPKGTKRKKNTPKKVSFALNGSIEDSFEEKKEVGGSSLNDEFGFADEDEIQDETENSKKKSIENSVDELNFDNSFDAFPLDETEKSKNSIEKSSGMDSLEAMQFDTVDYEGDEEIKDEITTALKKRNSESIEEERIASLMKQQALKEEEEKEENKISFSLSIEKSIEEENFEKDDPILEKSIHEEEDTLKIDESYKTVGMSQEEFDEEFEEFEEFEKEEDNTKEPEKEERKEPDEFELKDSFNSSLILDDSEIDGSRNKKEGIINHEKKRFSPTTPKTPKTPKKRRTIEVEINSPKPIRNAKGERTRPRSKTAHMGELMRKSEKMLESILRSSRNSSKSIKGEKGEKRGLNETREIEIQTTPREERDNRERRERRKEYYDDRKEDQYSYYHQQYPPNQEHRNRRDSRYPRERERERNRSYYGHPPPQQPSYYGRYGNFFPPQGFPPQNSYIPPPQPNYYNSKYFGQQVQPQQSYMNFGNVHPRPYLYNNFFNDSLNQKKKKKEKISFMANETLLNPESYKEEKEEFENKMKMQNLIFERQLEIIQHKVFDTNLKLLKDLQESVGIKNENPILDKTTLKERLRKMLSNKYQNENEKQTV